MKGLKNLAIFVAGGMTCVYLMAKGCERDSMYPREGSIIFENDEIRVIRCGDKPNKRVDLATVVYKKNAKE